MSKLSHFDPAGEPRMVDVGGHQVRQAITVHVSDRHLRGAWRVEDDCRIERPWARLVVEEYIERAVVEAGRHQVREPVAIEVRRGEVQGIEAVRGKHGRPENAGGSG